MERYQINRMQQNLITNHFKCSLHFCVNEELYSFVEIKTQNNCLAPFRHIAKPKNSILGEPENNIVKLSKVYCLHFRWSSMNFIQLSKVYKKIFPLQLVLSQEFGLSNLQENFCQDKNCSFLLSVVPSFSAPNNTKHKYHALIATWIRCTRRW